MRLVACLTPLCLMPLMANAAQTDTPAPSDPQAYCLNSSGDFYLYAGEPCKSGYQLGSGNCRKTNGRIVAVPKEECLAQAGTVELHFFTTNVWGGRPPRLAADARPSAESYATPTTRQAVHRLI